MEEEKPKQPKSNDFKNPPKEIMDKFNEVDKTDYKSESSSKRKKQDVDKHNG